MRTRSPLALALMLGACTLACDERAPADQRQRIQSSAVSQDTSALALRLEVPSPVSVGEVVDFRLVLVNRSDSTMTFVGSLPATAFNVVVRRGDGSLVWSRLDDATVPGIGQGYALAPRDSLVHEVAWTPRTVGDGPVQAGYYTVTATFHGQRDSAATPGDIPSAGPLMLRVIP